jgi:two-component sensor histidine kinase
MDPVLLSVNQAVPLGLILNELVTNALKHAFHGRAEGEISVSLRAGQDGLGILSVSDNGIGFPTGFDWPQAQTLGLRLVDMLTAQLQGSKEVSQTEGTEFRITFKIAAQQKAVVQT